jgi:diguanylate cyclase (GGDEF)-like protein/PAS domain S-box-containing protein
MPAEFAYMECRDMKDHDLLWVADRDLQITTLSARLRDLLFPNGAPTRLHVSELWQGDDPLGMLLVAHQWVLEGDHMVFDTERGGMRLQVVLEPLYDLSGAIAGVGGRAIPGAGDGQGSWDAAALEEIEQICGFGAWRTDLQSGRSIWSAGLCSVLGLEAGNGARNLRDFDHPEDADAVAQVIREAEIAGTGYRCDHRIVRSDGTIRYVQEQSHVLYGEEGLARMHVGSLVDITERKAAEARLAHLAHYDPVSKLPNRTLLEQRLHASLARAQSGGTSCAVLFIDVDDFKRVNDTYGHAAGDDLLAAIGSRLNHHVRAGDTVARMSGDEFVVVLDDLGSREDAVSASRKVLSSFELPFYLEGVGDSRVGVSIGVAIYPENRVSAKALIDIADREMYAVKRNGGRGMKVAPSQEWPQGTSEDSLCEISSGDPYPLLTVVNG